MCSVIYRRDVRSAKMRGSYSTIAFHIERSSFKRRGKQKFSWPDGGEKTLHYESLSLKSGEH